MKELFCEKLQKERDFEKKQNILVVDICKEKLHYFEFVKPVCDILENNGVKYFVKNYKEIRKKDLKKSSHVIICGTSLFDNEFIKNYKRFCWIVGFNGKILGICGGMQIIGLIFGGKIKKETEIGFYEEDFFKDFLGLIGKKEVYHLHNNYVDFSKLGCFEIFSNGKIAQAIKHVEKEIYGVLFHPEVRQKDLIVRFCSL